MQANKESKNPEKVNDKETTVKSLDKKNVALSRIKRRILRHTWFLRGLIIAASLFLVYFGLLLVGQLVQKSQAGFYIGLAKDFVFTPSDKISSSRGRTNILVLGKGGEGHEAPDLTDTIIFASVNSENITLISLPRDIWIPELRTKLNSVYYWGNKKQGGGGLILTKSSVEEIVGQPIHYAVLIDFEGFKKMIDVVGGIEVEVDTSFMDEKYPIEGRENDPCDGDTEYKCRYETVSFEKGTTHMDGETALKFVRSRNAEGDEGTDFARAKRQQKVISAMKNKILSREILFSPKKLLELKKVAEEYTETDIDSSAGAILARYFLAVRNSITSHVLSEDLLERPPYSPTYDNLYVFIPKLEDPETPLGRSWEEVHEWTECVLETNGNCS